MAYEHITPVHFDCSTNVQRCTGVGFESVGALDCPYLIELATVSPSPHAHSPPCGRLNSDGRNIVKALVPCPISGMRSEGSLVVRPDRRQNFCLIIQLTLYGWIASKLAGKVSGSPFA